MPDLSTPLSAWFTAHGRPLPWRVGAGPWGILVSEVMLQQTPVARVREPWDHWMERWPTAADLAAASPADVLRAWGNLGYPRRALRLRQTAVAVVERYTGVLPSTVEELQSLPGIGSYTAAAVAAFAFGRRVVVLDTNIRRVLARAIGGEQLPPPAPLIAERRRAEAALPADPAEAVVWNMSLMELGALVCTARSPRCESCPIACDCAWHQAGGPPDSYAAVRRTQPWLGSDRQARGRVMAQLRAEGEGILAATVGDLIGDSAQAERAVAGLLADGLARRVGDRFMLPSE